MTSEAHSSRRASWMFERDRGCEGELSEKEMLINSPRSGGRTGSCSLVESRQRCDRPAGRPGNGVAADVRAIGISYQMHGLVLVDKDGSPLRPSIIWCDSRATEIGRKAFSRLVKQSAFTDAEFSGNFTASKLCWSTERTFSV